MKKLIIGSVALIVIVMGLTYLSVVGSDANALNEVGSNVNLYAMIAALAIIAISVGVVLKYVNQMQNDTATGEDSGHDWDGIREFTNEIPKGWAIMYIILIVWMLWYFLVGFPLNSYSQIGEYNDEVKAHKEKFEKEHANMSADDLKNMGESVFSVNCAPCHGIIGDGQSGVAEDLTKRLSAASIEHVINNGSNQLGYAVGMPAGMAYGDDVKIIADYIAGGMKGEQPAAYATCGGCHGMSGEGIDMVGPSLNKLTASFVTYILEHGKKGAIGTMPKFDRLTDTQIKAVSAFVESEISQ
jgi:cytochrome c oxidase cbb3-type subunit III